MYFWPRDVVKCSICYVNVYPSICLSCLSHLRVVPKRKITATAQFKVIQDHYFRYLLEAHMRLPIS